MIYTNDFFSIGSTFPSDDFVQLVDSNTLENVNYIKTTTWIDGTSMDDSKKDSAIYRKKGTEYYVRDVIFRENTINVKWFGAKGNLNKEDVGDDDTAAFLEAIKTATKIFPTRHDSNAQFGGFTLYIPNGKYKLTETLVLPHNTTLLGESKKGVIIHQQNPKANVTNITGRDPITQVVSMSESVIIKNITFSQGGIVLQGASDSIIDDVTVTRLWGEVTDSYGNISSTGLSIKLPVNLKISNFIVKNSSGVGILYEDSAGTGPSTTVTFNNIWVKGCKTGMLINGLLTGSHGILTSWINNSIFEYNETGVEIKGITRNLSFRDIHFEQNKKYALIASESASFSLENIWADGLTAGMANTNDFLIKYNAGLTSNNIVHLKNLFIESGMLVEDNYEGTVYVDGFVNDFKYYDQNIKIYKTFDDIGPNYKRPIAPISGYQFYNSGHSKPEFFDGGSWRNADGMNADLKRYGTTSERPSNNLDYGFTYFDLTIDKPIYWQGTKWVKADGTNA
ncbi:glycosyl hydrolase family 28-related protein [Chryseobacterium shigense]|uniref:Rhamnogalacturonase A/B/Epimerase-like pectate lyase domain-containing protein n=1 Tax=Chryseobacterium shigense TaxID=297244 RepID=A0A841N8N0_9FLAO|nr:glycosyl hydrolase family 28-related protein [Chryseobacterium shigense]MBB6371433.1 hypothetical protein [Chryseobacterium shigense]